MIYLDYNATTPCDPDVVNSMIPYFSSDFANASSNHAQGWMAKEAIDNAIDGIAKLLGIRGDEIAFTSGATESINMVLKSLFFANAPSGNHIITAKTEHKAVLDTCEWLKGRGGSVTYLEVNEKGIIDVEQLEAAIQKETILVAIMFANNENGAIQPIKEVKKICHRHDIPLFSDATQALGKWPLNDFFEQVDFACFSAHKFYGPKGIGFTYTNKKSQIQLDSFIQGGGQQKGRRGGTLNTPLIIGLAEALKKALSDFENQFHDMLTLRNKLERGLLKIEGTHLNSSAPSRLPNTANIAFDYVDGEKLLRALSTKLAVSNGSACNSASVDPSHVLTAMGLSDSLAYASLRFSIGRQTTENEIDIALQLIADEVRKLRHGNILWERRHDSNPFHV